MQQAAEQAMVLGSADILLTELLDLLTPHQAAVLLQVAVSRAPMTLDDLSFIFSASIGAADGPPDLRALRADVDRLADLTLLTADESIVMHPWSGELITRNAGTSLTAQHQRALAMRLRRFVNALPGTLATIAYLAEIRPRS